jgi:hypothetical protein
MSAFMYLSKDGPRYRQGHAALLGFCVMAAILSLILTVRYRKENARRDATYRDPSVYTDGERHRERQFGDDASFFRYTI